MTSTETALIDIAGVDVAIAGTTILHDIRWRLEPGQHWGVVGANGSGKSTFLALLSGARWPAPGRGVRTYDFGHGAQHDAVEARREITLVGHELQDRYAHWGWNFKAVDVVLSGIFRTDVPRKQAAPAENLRARAILRDLGLEHLTDRPFLELSRGEQRRVLIARSLAFRPLVLLLDEPASGLDAASRQTLNEMLGHVAERAQLISTGHAIEDLPPIVTHVVEIVSGRIVASGPRNGDIPHFQPLTGDVARFPAERTESRHHEDMARPAPPHAEDPAHRPPAPAPDPSSQPPPDLRAANEDEALIDVRGAEVWLGGRRVLHDIAWQLREDEHWLVTGANGAGKSSFLRLLHGQLRPSLGGRVSWPALGNPGSVWTLRRRIAWVSPELQAGYRYRSSVHDCVASGFDSSLGLIRRLRPEERERVEVLLARFDLTEFAARKLTELSYGQFRRVLLARALVHRPRILLLDEPWEGLDRPTGALLAQRLDESVAEGTQLVCASHLAIYEQRYTHELVLDRGSIVFAGRRRASAGELA